MLFGLEGASTDIAGDRHRGTSESQDFRMPLVPPRQDKSNDAGFAVLGPMASAAPTAFRFGCPHAGRLLTASLVLARRGVLRRLSRGWVAAAKCLDPKLQLRFTRSTNDKFGAGVEMARLHRGIQLPRKCSKDAHPEPRCGAELEICRKPPAFIAHRKCDRVIGRRARREPRSFRSDYPDTRILPRSLSARWP